MKINTVCGRTQLISMKNFIKKLNILICEDGFAKFSTSIKGIYGGPVSADEETPCFDSFYVRKITKIIEGDKDDIVSSGIISQSTLTERFKDSLYDMAEDIAIDYFNEFGTLQYIVNIAPRLWMVANTDDFTVYTNKDNTKWGVSLFASHRAVVYSVSKITQKQADKMAQEYIEKHNLKKDKGSVE